MNKNREAFNQIAAGGTMYLSYRQLEQMKQEIKDNGYDTEKDYLDQYLQYRVDPNDIERSTYECWAKISYKAFVMKKVVDRAKRRQ